MRAPEIADDLGVSVQRAYAVIANIPGTVRLGRSVRVPESAWRSFIASGGYRNEPESATK
jgi:predicted DNA-binding transcriptional regulator AlpA